jgi:hypothetical protein
MAPYELAGLAREIVQSPSMGFCKHLLFIISIIDANIRCQLLKAKDILIFKVRRVKEKKEAYKITGIQTA